MEMSPPAKTALLISGVVLAIGAIVVFATQRSSAASAQSAPNQPTKTPVQPTQPPPTMSTDVVGGSINDTYIYATIWMWNGTNWQSVEDGWMLSSHARAVQKSVGHAFWTYWSIWQPAPINAWHNVQVPPDGQLDIAI